MTRWARPAAALALSSAIYGFSIGVANSWVYGLRNLVKFPLLIVVTAATCALCYHVASKFLGAPLTFVRVQRVVLGVFLDISVLLASLTPVVLYLAATMVDPVAGDLGGYPGFLRFNVVAIAATGCLSVVLRARRELPDTVVDGRRRALLLTAWMGASLLVGGQVCWYIRPFFGSTPGSWKKPWFAGATQDPRGAGSFYEAVYHLMGGR